MIGKTRMIVFFITGVIIAIALSAVGYWEFMFIPMIPMGYAMRSRSIVSLALLGLAGAVGAMASILLNPYAIQDGAVTAAIIGAPGGPAIPLALTLTLAFLNAGLGGAAGAQASEIIRNKREGKG
ncbi:hypothetical protein GCM10007981_06250 [Thermocladium modestius]|uniref:Uncharacterized protein n=1 Tax=Thermocladium modestius TaxID=62609 RepID=A0A830GVI4_9CREN|nr:hypothetical protein [Thermocladium modestius]GGP20010.1 hypothetical protein GCM10007981_06250 [Thermocladium modestius]